jgi:hypothetical protein
LKKTLILPLTEQGEERPQSIGIYYRNQPETAIEFAIGITAMRCREEERQDGDDGPLENFTR